jgi:hypothetical protein
MHHIARLLETNSYVRCLCIDFSKAFETVYHEILLAKLRALQLPRFVFNWLISFLTERSQVRKLDGKFSAPRKITRSIIQGVWNWTHLIYCNGRRFTSYISHQSNIQICGRHNLLVPENTDVDLKSEYDYIKHWAIINKMCINESKTKEIVFHRPCPRKYHVFNPIDGIERVNQIRLLGVIIQDTFSVDEHVNYILSVCNQLIVLIKNPAGPGLPLKHLHTIYHQALIVSRLLYARGLRVSQICYPTRPVIFFLYPYPTRPVGFSTRPDPTRGSTRYP